MSTIYYFIRHAEKDESNPKNRDPHLSEAGRKRAEKWAEVFREVEFDFIFSSDFHRTRETATTIAGSKDKQVEIYDHGNLNDEGFQKKDKRENSSGGWPHEYKSAVNKPAPGRKKVWRY